jgi:hypothetical protein
MIRGVPTGFWIRISDPGVKKAPDPATLQKRLRQLVYGIFFPLFVVVGTEMEKSGAWIRDGKIRIQDKHPGSATLQRSQTI